MKIHKFVKRLLKQMDNITITKKNKKNDKKKDETKLDSLLKENMRLYQRNNTL